MIMDERTESTVCHGVLKVARAIERGDLRREPLPDTEVTRLPGDVLPQLNQPGCSTSDSSFPRA